MAEAIALESTDPYSVELDQIDVIEIVPKTRAVEVGSCFGEVANLVFVAP